jgi:polar amino acid transport system substrate-binding protein
MKNLMISIIIFTLIIFSSWAFANNVKILCDPSYIPTEYEDENGKLRGFTVEIVREIQKRIGNQIEIEPIPWARAYDMGLREPNIVLFTASRNADRENKFHWITQITTRRSVFFAKRDSPLKINSIEDAKKVSSIGVKLKENRTKYLEERDFTNLEGVPLQEHNLLKLIKGRIDLIFMSTLEAAALAKKKGVSFIEIEPKFTVYSNDSYIIMSKNGTSPKIVKKWQEAAKAIKDDGTFERIGEKWVIYLRTNYQFETEIKNGVFNFWKD